ncbi:UBX domain-containing protein 4 isoform X2 [Halyomorpha halys]|nr:UBX domain-containing protein 4 isoform X2 [Halyomorpha halys]
MSEVLDTGEICSDLSSDQFVSIKLAANDVGYRQFVEIYKLVPVPSLYFIGNSGAPIDIVAANASRLNLETKIKEAIGKCNVKSGKIPSNTTMSSPNVTDSPGPSTSQALEQPLASNDVPEVGSSAQKEEVDPKPSLEERVEKAKKLLVIKKQEKEAKEIEDEKQKEFERRKMGQEVLKMKKKQQDKELQEMIEEREREKRESAAAKQRILEQIAQDRAERLEREQRMKAGSSNSSTQIKPSAAPSAPPAESPANPTTARIQFKLPTGEAKTHSFPPNTTLLQVRDFINNNIELSFSDYRLATTFPRREFTSDDDESTLLSLNLTPTGVILILPLAVSNVRPHATDWLKIISNLFWDMVQPVFSVANYIQQYFTSGPSADSRPSESESSPPPQSTPGARAFVRRSGNIHSLRDMNDGNDENNTWNGNSTQQM